MRTRKKPWTSREIAENAYIVKNPADNRGKWRGYFGNNNPIHLEIGCGKGKFLSEAARAFPSVNFIGLERDPVILAAAARLNRVTGGAPAAYIISDAESLPELFAPGEIQAMYIHFCDPWPNKKKWAKRRLTHSRFLNMYAELGIERIYFKTDNRLLFDFSVEQFKNSGWVLEDVNYDLHAVRQDPRFVTEYEEKFIAKGQPIYRLEARRGQSGGRWVERTNGEDEEPDKANIVYAQKKPDIEQGDAEDNG